MYSVKQFHEWSTLLIDSLERDLGVDLDAESSERLVQPAPIIDIRALRVLVREMFEVWLLVEDEEDVPKEVPVAKVGADSVCANRTRERQGNIPASCLMQPVYPRDQQVAH
jgi:hypothetical protein